MAKIIINKDRCKGCLFCVYFCPKGLIKKGGKLNKRGMDCAEFVDNGSCVGCGFCAVVCPECCIEVFK